MSAAPLAPGPGGLPQREASMGGSPYSYLQCEAGVADSWSPLSFRQLRKSITF